LRYTAAALTLGCYALIKHLRLPGFHDLVGIALLGLVGIAFYGVALNTGELSVPSAVASFLINMAPIFVALEARLWLGERLHRLGWLGEWPSWLSLVGGVLVLTGVMVVNAGRQVSVKISYLRKTRTGRGT
jgi:drug/metabolite transporter (DMT)-like permease